MISTSQANVRTMEFRPAQVHITGNFAGLIEVPVIGADETSLDSELDELYLHVAGEDRPLRALGRAHFGGALRLAFFSKTVRETRKLPRRLALDWGEPFPSKVGGMELCVQEARKLSS